MKNQPHGLSAFTAEFQHSQQSQTLQRRLVQTRSAFNGSRLAQTWRIGQGKTHPKTGRTNGPRFLMVNRTKSDLPSKICLCCGRPYLWRKKWAKVWDEVKFCSDRCRRAKKEYPLFD
jgi:hypothetical protein